MRSKLSMITSCPVFVMLQCQRCGDNWSAVHWRNCGGQQEAAQDTGGGHRTQCLPPPQIRCKSLMSPLVHTALLCSAAVRPVSLEPGAKEPIAQLSQRGYIALIAGRVEVAMIVISYVHNLDRRVWSVWHQMSIDHTTINGRRILDTGMTLVYNLFEAQLRLSPPYPSQSRWRRFPSFRHH